MKPTSSAEDFHLVSVAQAAELLQCSEGNVYALIAAGKLVVTRVGRRKGYRIDVRDLAQFVDASKFRCLERIAVPPPTKLRHIKR